MNVNKEVVTVVKKVLEDELYKINRNINRNRL